jgi:leucyl aminopeptidase
MKKFLFALPALLTLSAIAQNTEAPVSQPTAQELAQVAVKHLDQATDYKLEWFDYEKDLHADKYDILKKHFKEKMELKKKLITQLGKNEDVKAYLANSTEQMKELKKKQHLEWKTLEDKWHETAQDQAKAQATALGIETEEENSEETE